jgi:hypothetical protein
MENCKAIFSTAYLPPIHYFRFLTLYDEIYIESHETYPKQTFRNRCVIYSANGPIPLIIPVEKPFGNRTKIKEVRIDNTVKWRKEHWRALESAYRSSAYFEYVHDYFKPFFDKEMTYLWDLNLHLLETIKSILEIKVRIKETYEFKKEYGENYSDYRYSINPKSHKAQIQSFEPLQYFQVFAHKAGFVPNLSIFDLICNSGMESIVYLQTK